EGTYLCEISQCNAPLGIESKLEPRGSECLKDPVRGLLVAEIARNQSKAWPPSWLLRVLLKQPLDDRSHLGEPTLLTPNGEHLHPVDALDMLALAVPAHLVGLLGKPFGTDKVTIKHGLHGASMPGYPTLDVFTFLSPALVLREGAVHTRPIAELSRLVDLEADGAS